MEVAFASESSTHVRIQCFDNPVKFINKVRKLLWFPISGCFQDEVHRLTAVVCEVLRYLLVLLSWERSMGMAKSKVCKQITNLSSLLITLIANCRALRGEGNFQLAPAFSKFKITISAWNNKTEEEKEAYFTKFLNAKIKDDKNSITSTDG